MAKVKDQGDLQEVVLRLFNSQHRRVSFILEPWGEVYDFEPKDDFTVVFLGPVGGCPEIDFGSETVTVYGWTGSYASVFKNGSQVRSGMPDSGRESLPVPEIP